MNPLNPVYAKPFFDLQWHFAETVSALSGCSLAHALLKYTNFYIRFGLGRDLNPQHPLWQAYLTGLQETPDPQGWTYRFYLARRDSPSEPKVLARFGCFAYALGAENTLRLHFRHADLSAPSSLGRDHREQRCAELTALFAHVRAHHAEDLQVKGVSWLYNLPAYRSLFPAVYGDSARRVPARFHSLALWGQFLDRRGDLKPEMARYFLKRLREQGEITDLHACFPLPLLSVKAHVQVFYAKYVTDLNSF